MSTLRKEEAALINQSDGLKLFAKLSFIKPAIVGNRRGYYYDYLFICFACSWLIDGGSPLLLQGLLFFVWVLPILSEDLRTFSFTTYQYRTTRLLFGVFAHLGFVKTATMIKLPPDFADKLQCPKCRWFFLVSHHHFKLNFYYKFSNIQPFVFKRNVYIWETVSKPKLLLLFWDLFSVIVP